MNPNDPVNQQGKPRPDPGPGKSYIDLNATLAHYAKIKAAKEKQQRAAVEPHPPISAKSEPPEVRLASDTHPLRHEYGRHRIIPLDF